MNRTKKIASLSILIVLLIGIYSCSKTQLPDTSKEALLNLPETNYDYSKEFGDHFADSFSGPRNIDFDAEENRKIELGRVLFYDKRLSINNTTSCSSCHIQQNAFSDKVAFSKGFREEETSRNSMPLFNDAFENGFFWDNSIWGLENQVLMPIENHVEMGIEDDKYLIKKLSLVDYYNTMFAETYGRNISMNLIRDALTNFVSSIYSINSKYDAGYENKFADFTNQERLGLSLYFKSGCNGCHNLEVSEFLLSSTFLRDELFNNGNFNDHLGIGGDVIANIGLDLQHTDEGAGRGLFKTPSVRNVELTAPYMHDGRFETLEEVIEHYNEGIQPHQHLDCRLTGQCNSYDDAITNPNKSEPIQFDFNEEEQQALVAFLKTLTDNELINSPLYSDPFK